MLSLTSQQIAAISADNIIVRRMILFDFPTGVYGFWDGLGPLVWNGVTYNSGGQLFEVEGGTASTGLEAEGRTVRLYANPDAGLTGSILRTIFAEKYRGRRCDISVILIDSESRAMISAPVPEFSGLIQSITEQGSSDKLHLEAKLEGRNILNANRGFQTRSTAHWKRVDANDKFFDFASKAGTTPVYFGRAAPKKAAQFVRSGNGAVRMV